ncbi:MAG: alpha/beta fold hydrolase [Anaerolineae bacterium]|nr:alpha/beta fold hydrolase [Anaerolineae bacterium]
MLKRLTLTALIVITLVALAAPAAAQGPQPERVEVEAADGLILVGHYYAPPASENEAGSPAVLLMHHGGGQKEAWIDLFPFLFEAGYSVLTVDLRAHGETGGDDDWVLAEDDTQRWLAWLRDQPGIDPDAVSIVGASLGADIGLRVMADDPQLVTLVGLSVLLDALGINTEEAVVAIGDRPLFLVFAQRVEAEALTAVTLLAASQGDVQLRLYNTTACCTYLIMMEDDLAPAIIDWLDFYSR